MRVIVVGGGWAGRTAALELCVHGAEVTLFEAAPQLGGRARTVERDGRCFDNGQHLLIGAYRATLRRLALAGGAEATVFTRQPLRWLTRGGVTVDIAAPRWVPAPLHMAWALRSARGYGWRERVAALRACGAVLRTEPSGGDMAVVDWLRQPTQPPRVVASLWDPFLERRTDADLLLPRCDLGAVFPAPAAESIRSRGGRLRLNERVLGLTSDATRVTGVRSRHGEHAADHVIVALPPRACAALLDDRAALAPLAAQLSSFEYEPICTAYLRVSALSLTAPMTGLVAADFTATGYPATLEGAVRSGVGAARDVLKDG